MSLEVLTRSKCEKCKGTGIVHHPAWAQFWRENPNWTGTDGHLISWFFNAGWCADDHSPIPNEEIPCDDCDGTGWQQKWISLVRLLLDYVPTAYLRERLSPSGFGQATAGIRKEQDGPERA